MNADPRRKIEELCQLAEEAELAAETTADPAHGRALRLLALQYQRLADFVLATARALGHPTDPPQTETGVVRTPSDPSSMANE